MRLILSFSSFLLSEGREGAREGMVARIPEGVRMGYGQRDGWVRGADCFNLCVEDCAWVEGVGGGV